MNIEKLEYLVEVAKTGSFSIASQNLYVSQSAISQSIVSLEKKLGVKLFERSRGNSAVPTIEGEEIITIAKEMFIKFQELVEKANVINGNISGKLKISAVPGFTTTLSKPISSIKNEYPKINIEIYQKPGNDIVDDIIEGRSDIGIVPFFNQIFENNDQLITRHFLDAKMKLLVSKKSPLAERKFVTPEEIVKESLILYNGEYIQIFKRNFFNKFGEMNELFATTNIDMLKNTISDTLCVSFVPDFKNVDYNFGDQYVLIDIVDYEEVNFHYVWIMSSKKHLSRLIRDYIAILKEELN
ncbi:LysR family transcriptional regulator [Gottfriedia acidiceleris]|uniref:LysR family transcriptional regulator n=1 Tax=Gottfriedia acidiceleris TaxID=371036 RepID=UPI003D20A35E